jgi:hypothetical protein
MPRGLASTRPSLARSWRARAPSAACPAPSYRRNPGPSGRPPDFADPFLSCRTRSAASRNSLMRAELEAPAEAQDRASAPRFSSLCLHAKTPLLASCPSSAAVEKLPAANPNRRSGKQPCCGLPTARNDAASNWLLGDELRRFRSSSRNSRINKLSPSFATIRSQEEPRLPGPDSTPAVHPRARTGQ